MATKASLPGCPLDCRLPRLSSAAKAWLRARDSPYAISPGTPSKPHCGLRALARWDHPTAPDHRGSAIFLADRGRLAGSTEVVVLPLSWTSDRAKASFSQPAESTQRSSTNNLNSTRTQLPLVDINSPVIVPLPQSRTATAAAFGSPDVAVLQDAEGCVCFTGRKGTSTAKGRRDYQVRRRGTQQQRQQRRRRRRR